MRCYPFLQELALLDVRKELSFCRKVGLPILGLVENMSGFVCPKCSKTSSILPPSSGGADKLAADTAAPLLGKVPIDPRVAKACDLGENIFEDDSATVAKTYINITKQLVSKLGDQNAL